MTGTPQFRCSSTLVLLAALAGCAPDAPTLAEPDPPQLAQRVEKLLDDPSVLARPAPAVPPAAVDVAGTPPGEVAPVAVAAVPAAPADAAPAEAAPSPPVQPGGPADTARPQPATAPQPETAPAVAPVAPMPKADPPQPKADPNRSKPEPTRPDKPRPAKPEPPAPEPPAQPQVAIPEGADATDLYYGGKRKLDAGDLKGAIADLRASQQLRPSVRTLTLLGRALFDDNQLGPAAKVLQSVGGHDEAQLLLAMLFQQTGKTGQARKVYEAFLKAHPDHAKANWVRNVLQTL